MFNPDETLTHEQILLRFRKIFHREMTPEEQKAFFLDVPTVKREKATTAGDSHD